MKYFTGTTAEQIRSDEKIRATFGSEVFVGKRQRNLALDEKKGGEQ